MIGRASNFLLRNMTGVILVSLPLFAGAAGYIERDLAIFFGGIMLVGYVSLQFAGLAIKAVAVAVLGIFVYAFSTGTPVTGLLSDTYEVAKSAVMPMIEQVLPSASDTAMDVAVAAKNKTLKTMQENGIDSFADINRVGIDNDGNLFLAPEQSAQ